MTVLVTQGLALVLFVAGMVLVSLGSVEANPALVGAGVAALGAGGVLPIASRFFGHPAQPEEARDCGMAYDERTS